MKIATWNINGIKARHDVLLDWLKEADPDVACLQEVKSVDENFPRTAFEDLGYNLETHGQKGFNGVAIFSKTKPEDVIRGLPGNEADEQARYIEAVIPAGDTVVRVASIYLPNGNPVDTEKYPYKLDWMEHLKSRANDLISLEENTVLLGDYNVIPMPADCHDPKAWAGDALFLPQSRAAFREILNLGYTEAVRSVTSADKTYTFWDYQAGAWQKNNGIRIDHALLSPQAADRLKSCHIDAHVRDWPKPSDHVPVVIEIAA